MFRDTSICFVWYHIDTYAYISAYMYACAHIYTHTHTTNVHMYYRHAHAHTHTHTHTQIYRLKMYQCITISTQYSSLWSQEVTYVTRCCNHILSSKSWVNILTSYHWKILLFFCLVLLGLPSIDVNLKSRRERETLSDKPTTVESLPDLPLKDGDKSGHKTNTQDEGQRAKYQTSTYTLTQAF